MNCFTWNRLGCFVLVQLAVCAGCAKAPDQAVSPGVRLIIPEEFRGVIDFDETREPMLRDKKGNLRIEVRKYGSADIDSIDRLESASITASLSSGEVLKVTHLMPHEVGLRSVVVYQLHHNSLKTVYFVGTFAALEKYLEEEYRTHRSSTSEAPHRVESKPHQWAIAQTDVTPEVFEGAPKWDGEGEPPVNLERAIKLAREACASGRIWSDLSQHSPFDRAALMKWSVHHRDHWYWRIRFNCHSSPGYVEVVVLMNGRVLPVDIFESSRQIDPSF